MRVTVTVATGMILGRLVGDMNARGDEFFEDTIRLGRIFDLIKPEKIREEFERKVVGDTERAIELRPVGEPPKQSESAETEQERQQ